MNIENLKVFADNFDAMTCVISVEKKGDSYGEIRIVTGNRSYIDSIEKPAPGAEMLTKEFIPNSLYTRYLTTDLNFEDYCYRAAVHKKCLHCYVHPDRLDVWFHLIFLPLCSDDDLYYCTYTMEMSFEPDSAIMSNVSGDVAARVLETSIKIRGNKDFRKAMDEVITDIGEMLGSEHTCILLLDEKQRKCSVLCENIKEGSELLPMETYVDEGFYDIAESWEGTIAGSNCIVIKNEHDMLVLKERNPVWYESLTAASAKTIIMFPLKFNNTLLGYMWAINFTQENAGKIKEVLELTTFILSSEISNYMLMDRLRIMGSTDMLTGVMNRNEMNFMVDRMSSGGFGKGSAGVLFVDLNGLKVVNDNEGHNAGDKLLKDTAEALLEVFPQRNIFRAGGDEFCIILQDVKEQEVDLKAAAIKEAIGRRGNINIAMGCCVVGDKCDIRRALHEADEKMYEDKKEFYRRNPDLGHRHN